jgi:hypothetical protein
VGRVVVLELLVAGVGCTSQSGQPAMEATACIFGAAKRLLQHSRSRAIEEVS